MVEMRKIRRYTQRNAEETQNTESQPLIVKMTDAKLKWDIIRFAMKLGDSQNGVINRIRIVPDLTKEERELDKILREELKDKNITHLNWRKKFQRKNEVSIL